MSRTMLSPVKRTLLGNNLVDFNKFRRARLSTMPSPPSTSQSRLPRVPKNDLTRIHNVLRDSSHPAAARSRTDKVDHYGLSGRCLEIRIAKSREYALADACSDSLRHIPTVYTDGSRLDEGVGAAAWSATLPGSSTTQVIQHFHLGRSDERTVLEAELVGVLLALGLVRAVRQLMRAIILSDSQSAIVAIRNGEVNGGERCLVAEFYRQLNLLVRSRPALRVVLQWVPAHEGAGGNARADKEAKCAAAAPGPRPETRGEGIHI